MFSIFVLPCAISSKSATCVYSGWFLYSFHFPGPVFSIPVQMIKVNLIIPNTKHTIPKTAYKYLKREYSGEVVQWCFIVADLIMLHCKWVFLIVGNSFPDTSKTHYRAALYTSLDSRYFFMESIWKYFETLRRHLFKAIVKSLTAWQIPWTSTFVDRNCPLFHLIWSNWTLRGKISNYRFVLTRSLRENCQTNNGDILIFVRWPYCSQCSDKIHK